MWRLQTCLCYFETGSPSKITWCKTIYPQLIKIPWTHLQTSNWQLPYHSPEMLHSPKGKRKRGQPKTTWWHTVNRERPRVGGSPGVRVVHAAVQDKADREQMWRSYVPLWLEELHVQCRQQVHIIYQIFYNSTLKSVISVIDRNKFKLLIIHCAVHAVTKTQLHGPWNKSYTCTGKFLRAVVCSAIFYWLC